MLVLGRKAGESVFIGDDIQVAVVSVRGNEVRLGIKAPTDVPVHREEIYRRIQAIAAGATPEEAIASTPLHAEGESE